MRNSEGILAVTDDSYMCIHLLKIDGAMVRSIGKGMLGGDLGGITLI